MSDVHVITDPISREELRSIAAERFGDLVKAVVDIERRVMAIGGELHADEEQVLLDQGSRQEDLWGINFYPDADGDAFLEFDSMINLRPSQGNRSRGIDDAEVRERVRALAAALVSP